MKFPLDRFQDGDLIKVKATSTISPHCRSDIHFVCNVEQEEHDMAESEATAGRGARDTALTQTQNLAITPTLTRQLSWPAIRLCDSLVHPYSFPSCRAPSASDSGRCPSVLTGGGAAVNGFTTVPPCLGQYSLGSVPAM
jgi:hypothetical protein